MTLSPRETFIARADAVARETGWNTEEHATEHEWSAVGLGPVGQHRDSDARDRCNFDVIYADLRERFGDAVASVSFGHWGFGWVEEISFDADNADVVEAVEAWEVALADYPVADEMKLSELEYNEACEMIARDLRSEIDRDDIEYVLTEIIDADEMAGRIFSWVFDNRSLSRAEEIGDDDIEDAAFALGFYAANVQPLTEHIERLETRLSDIEAMIADVDRGIRTLAEVRDAVNAATDIYA